MDLQQELTYLFLLSMCTEELLSTPNIIPFLPKPLPSGNEQLPLASNPIPCPEQEKLSGSEYVVNLTAPNKEFLNAPRLYGPKFIL